MQSLTGPTLGLERTEESRPQTGSDFYYAITYFRALLSSAQPLRSIDRPIESFASNSFLSPSPLSRIRIQHAISRLDEADGRFGDIY